MATPTIKIDQTGLGAGTAGQSRDDLAVGVLVTLTDPANPSGVSWSWVLANKPPGSASTLSGATTATATFTPDKPGTYLIELTVDGFKSYTVTPFGEHISTQGGCGLKFPHNNRRAPAAGETTQFSSTEGWHLAMYPTILGATRTLDVKNGDDITSALTAAVTQATRSGGYGGVIVIPEGRFKISSSIILPQVAGMHIRGASKWATTVSWDGGSSTVPMFDLNRCQSSGISDMKIEVESGRTLYCAWRSYNSDSALGGSFVVANQLASRNFIIDVDMQFAARATYGIRIVWDSITTAEKGKNDHHKFVRVQVQDYTHSGVVIQGEQPQSCAFDGCIIQGRDNGLYGINGCEPINGAYRCVGFNFRDGTIMENQYADVYYPRNFGDTLILDGVHSEGSRRFFDMPDFNQDSSTQVFTAVTMRNVKHHCPSVSKTISSFDDVNERLTVTAHGYVTGKGPVYLEVTGGSLPTGLFTNTPYYVIVVDANTISLATTVRLAQDGTKVTFTGAGSGTATVEWPESSGTSVRYFGSGTLKIENCTWGKENDPYNRYRIHVQGSTQGWRPQFTYDSLHSQNDKAQLFTGQLPTHVGSAYRRNNALSLGSRESALIAAVDNNRAKPVTENDWARLLGIVPRSWYRFNERYGNIDVPFTSVDAGDDEFDIAGHPYTHLDGPVRLTNSGGALPTGLSTATDYWIIVRNSGSIAFATSRNLAITNTQVGFSDQGSGTHTIVSSTTGAIYDHNTRLPAIDLVANAAPKYRQARANFDAEWAEFVTATIDQQFYLNNTTDLSPQSHSIAYLIHFGAISLTAGDEYLAVLGTGSTSAAGGPGVRFTSAGLPKVFLDSVETTGTFDYRTAGDYLAVIGYHRKAGGLFTFLTDKESLAIATPSLNCGNNARKGLGTGSNAGTLKTAGYQVGLFAVFTDEAAERLIEMGAEVHRRMGWTPVSDVDHPMRPMQKGGIEGLEISRGGAGKVSIAAGRCRSTDDRLNIYCHAGLTAQFLTSSSLTVTVVAAAGTFTRSAGDFTADGYKIGDDVTWSGFTNGGNNVTKRRITALTATVMTFSDLTGLVNETGNGDEAVTLSGAGGLDTGSEANSTWYSVWVIADSTGTYKPTAILSTSTSSPTMPTGYDKKRRLGWVRNDGSGNFLFWNQRGIGRTRTIVYDEARSVLSVLAGGTATSFTDVDCTALIPPGCDLGSFLFGFSNAGDAAGDTLDVRTNGANSSDGPWTFGVGSVSTGEAFGWTARIPTDAGRIIEYRVDTGNSADIWVTGYEDEL